MRTTLALAALAALSLTACDRPTGSAPQGSEVGAAMPDTTAAAGATTGAPDAGATGAVPANDAIPPAQAPEPATPPNTPGDGRIDPPK